MEVIRLSALRTAQEIFLVLISVRDWVNPGAIVRAGRIMSMKKSNDTIGNRTRDLPACSAVPQPTAPPAACPIYQNYDTVITSATSTASNFPCGDNVDCWNVFIWNLLSQTYTTKFSPRATCTISRHTHHTISQRPFANITLVCYILLKYYKFRFPM